MLVLDEEAEDVPESKRGEEEEDDEADVLGDGVHAGCSFPCRWLVVDDPTVVADDGDDFAGFVADDLRGPGERVGDERVELLGLREYVLLVCYHLRTPSVCGWLSRAQLASSVTQASISRS